MEHVISMEFHSSEVERKEAGESSRDNDQHIIVAGDTHKLTITFRERGSTSTSSKEEKFKKLTEAETKVQLGTTPKIREVLLLRGHKHYQKYCKPRVVSLGPIHHGKPKYQLTEEYKFMLADKFIVKTGRTVKELYGIIEDNIKELREYYDEKVTRKYSDEDLAWMLFVDGCATLQFIDSLVNETVKAFKIKNDQVAFVQQDLFLLENQLPYQLLDYLMKNIKEEENSKKEENLRKSIQTFINIQSMLAEGTKSSNADKKAIHLLDLLRKRLLGLDGVEDESAQENATDKEEDSTGKKPPSPPMKSTVVKKQISTVVDKCVAPYSFQASIASAFKKAGTAVTHNAIIASTIKKAARIVSTVPDKNEENDERDLEWQSFRNVQELREVGIDLKQSKSRSLREIEFTKKCNFYPGILSMPQITVDDSTGPKFFNLIAYEMCPDFENDFGITSYISFLDSLIDDPKDVIDLRSAGILRNLLGSDREVAEVFNEIGTDLVPNLDIYRKVRVQIQEYYDMKSMTWISQVLHTHFSSPWTIIAFLAAFVVLGLSVVQTVYSILANYKE